MNPIPAPSTAELLALVLGKDVAELLGDETQLRRLRLATVSELTGTYGLSDEAAIKTVAVLELGRRVESIHLNRGEQVRTAVDVYEHAKQAGLEDLMVEQFRVLLLDGKNRLMDEILVSQGSLTTAIVHPREVFAPAIRARANAVIFIHNHPSGDSSPSQDDVELTHRLCAAGDLMGIEVLDHLIVGRGEYTSFQEKSLLP